MASLRQGMEASQPILRSTAKLAARVEESGPPFISIKRAIFYAVQAPETRTYRQIITTPSGSGQKITKKGAPARTTVSGSATPSLQESPATEPMAQATPWSSVMRRARPAAGDRQARGDARGYSVVPKRT